MEFLTPLGLILSALALPIIALYLLKRRREDISISSTLLWERTLRDLEAHAPWQKLRRNLLLLLQLLALALLVLGAARPFMRTTDAGSANLVTIIDTSYSMGAIDVDGESRLDAARDRTLALFDGLPANGRMTLIRAGAGADVLIANSRDRQAVARALEDLQPTAADSDVSAAFNIAAASVARAQDSSIVLLSDGNVEVPPSLSLDAPVQFASLGSSGENQAISALTVRPQGRGYALFVQATNYGTDDVTRRLTLDVDGAPFTAVDLELPAGRRAERIFELPAETQRVHAQLAGDDILAVDDSAWAVPARAETRAIRLVTSGNRYLQAGLSLLPSVDVTVGTAVTQSTGSDADLTILDAGTMPESMPAGNLFFIAPEESIGDIVVTGVLSRPVPLAASNDDPLLRFVDLSDVAILDAVQTELPAWARPVIRDAETGVPLLWFGETEDRRIALLAFDLHRSDLPLRVAFPLLLSNLIDALTPGAGSGTPSTVRVGQPVSVPVPPAAEEIRLTMPDGTVEPLTPDAGIVAFTADRAGIYLLSDGDEFSLQIAAALFSPQESDVAPAETLEFGGDAGTVSGETQQGRREFWPWLIAAGLVILVVEWLVSQQDGLVRLRQWARQFHSIFDHA